MKTLSIQNNFLSGELSPLLKGNTDLEQYLQGLERAENVVIVPQGGVKRRAGLAYGLEPLKVLTRDTTVPTMPNGGTAANINDNNSGTSATTTTPIGVINPYVVAEYDLGVARTIDVVTLGSISISTGTSSEFKIQYSDDAASWTTVGVSFSLNTTQATKRLQVPSSVGARRYWRLARIGGTNLGAAVILLTEFNLFYNSVTLSGCKVFQIPSENGLNYLGILTAGNLRIVRLEGTFTEGESLAVPYTSSQVTQVRVLNVGGVTLLFHGSHNTRRIINYGDATINGGANTNPYDNFSYWFIDTVPYVNVPLYDFDDNLSPIPVAEQQDATFNSFTRGMRYQVEVSGVLSKNISYSGDATAAEQLATEENLRKNLQDMPVFGDTGISVIRVGVNQYRITLEGESADDYKLFSGFNTTGSASASITFTAVANGTARREPIWSINRGYPKMGAFYGGRLWIGGTRDKPQTVLGSKAGSLLDFDSRGGDDDDGIFYTLTSKGNSDITDIYAGRTLQVYTQSSEYSIDSESITPSTTNFRTQTSNGSLYVQVEEADGAVVFFDKNGKTVRENVYSFNEDAYAAIDISVLSSHLINTPVSSTFLTGSGSDDANWLFIINSDGSGVILNKLRSQDINGFTRMTSGLLKDCTVFGENVAFVVDREVNGLNKRLVEYWSFEHKMDSSVRKLCVAPIDGLDHLNGETVLVSVNGTILPPRVVSGGAITLTAAEQSRYDASDTIEVGLGFPVVVQPMPVYTQVKSYDGSGGSQMRIKKIIRCNMRVYETAGIYFDGVPVPARAFGGASLNTPLTPFTGVVDDLYPIAGFNRDIMPEITCPDPTPFHLQSIEFQVESP